MTKKSEPQKTSPELLRQMTMMQNGPQNFDPNLQEYTGTRAGLPHALWQPAEATKRPDFFKALGLEMEDLPASVLPEQINFLVWSQFVVQPKNSSEHESSGGNGLESSPELVQKTMQQQDDELSKIDTPAQRKHESD